MADFWSDWAILRPQHSLEKHSRTVILDFREKRVRTIEKSIDRFDDLTVEFVAFFFCRNAASFLKCLCVLLRCLRRIASKKMLVSLDPFFGVHGYLLNFQNVES